VLALLHDVYRQGLPIRPHPCGDGLFLRTHSIRVKRGGREVGMSRQHCHGSTDVYNVYTRPRLELSRPHERCFMVSSMVDETGTARKDAPLSLLEGFEDEHPSREVDAIDGKLQCFGFPVARIGEDPAKRTHAGNRPGVRCGEESGPFLRAIHQVTPRGSAPLHHLA